jgi:hypothetical protein
MAAGKTKCHCVWQRTDRNADTFDTYKIEWNRSHLFFARISNMFPVQANEVPRHQIIESLTARSADKVADASISLWAQMAAQIISIVGEGGFNALYARSVHLTQSTCPWLTASSLPPQTEHRFAKLKLNFESQTPAQAREANRVLLLTFTDILASLIGEQLTTRILCSAWGIVTPDQSSKEIENE